MLALPCLMTLSPKIHLTFFVFNYIKTLLLHFLFLEDVVGEPLVADHLTLGVVGLGEVAGQPGEGQTVFLAGISCCAHL